MNVNEFFEKYSIEEINKRTRISPISLNKIKNKEFDKLPRVKFLGFVKIIEKEFDINLDSLIQEYNSFTNPETATKTKETKKRSVKPDTQKKETQKEKNHNPLFLSLLALILFCVGAYLLFHFYTQKPTHKLPQVQNAFEKNTTKNTAKQKNTPENNLSLKQNITAPDKIKNKKASLPKEIKITPNNLLWFKAINLDTNKTVSYLTSNPKILKGPDWYIKFGHGNLTIIYGNRTITPKTRKILRILFKNGKVTYLKTPNRYEK